MGWVQGRVGTAVMKARARSPKRRGNHKCHFEDRAVGWSEKERGPTGMAYTPVSLQLPGFRCFCLFCIRLLFDGTRQ